ncbi:hypothetical protein COV19_05870 [Candidatus Woesearchaeota archaeon CG10_big_fil_rev_8_21_14_0_10_44_13]|nr:MAG: hypothetical protein COV19_05870 [Candidatus Woesearchaeota archaeon CG10_big_fil_rev_8_21_14_0_10_44_13]
MAQDTGHTGKGTGQENDSGADILETNIPETNIILPRNYGVAIRSGSNTLFCDPARYIIGHTIITTQPQLIKWLERWQAFKKDETQKMQEGTLSYSPKFPINGKEGLLQCPIEDLERILVDRIQKKEGSKNLWVEGGMSAIENPRIYGRSLEGMIKSKSKGFNSVHINNPFVTDSGLIQYEDIYSSAPDGDFESQKNLRVMGSHPAALETAQFMQLRLGRDFSIDYGKRNTRRINPTLAFDFVSNPFLSSLEVDVLIAHYVKGETLYSINRRLTEIFEHYSAALNRTGDVGLARFAVMRQKTKDFGRSSSYQMNENRWVRKIREKITEMGYTKMPYYTIVFKDSPYEMVAERYEKGSESIELACSFEHAPIVIKKTLQGDVNFHSTPEPYDHNPFLNMSVREGNIDNSNCRENVIDDCTRRRCMQTVFIPETLDMSGKMKAVYRRLITEAKRDAEKSRQFEMVF